MHRKVIGKVDNPFPGQESRWEEKKYESLLSFLSFFYLASASASKENESGKAGMRPASPNLFVMSNPFV